MRENMKKLLLASTALIGSAGLAAAEISPFLTLDGSAEIGIVGGTGDFNTNTQFYHSMDVNISFERELNGVVFGADIDLDEIGNGIGENCTQSREIVDQDVTQLTVTTTNNCKHIVYVNGGFGNFTMGDTDGAYDWALTELDWGGTINDLQTIHFGFNGNSGMDGIYDGQILRYDYDFANFGLAGSMELDDAFDNNGDIVWALGAKGDWEFGTGWNLGVGVGYQAGGDSANIWGASGMLGYGGFEIGVNYADAKSLPGLSLNIGGQGDGFDLSPNYRNGDGVKNTVFNDFTYWGVGASYTWEAWLFAANYGEYKVKTDGGSDLGKTKGGAIWANYELGDGLVVQGGWSDNKIEVDGQSNNFQGGRYSLGLSMTF
jgi:outer membrane protein OmpU